MEADETINEPGQPRLELTPEATFAGQADEGLPKYKEAYFRTERSGEKVYARHANPSQWITPEIWRSLPSTSGGGEKDAGSSTPATPKAASPSFFKGGVLSQAEAEELYEPLTAALSDGFGYMDQFLWMRYPDLDELPVWSNTSDLEDQKLAKLLLKRGQKSAGAATVVRTMIDWNDYAVVGMMLAPRIQKTVEIVREHRHAAAVNKRKISLFRKAEQHEA